MENWYSFLYCYVVGGILFSLPIVVAIRKGTLRLDIAAERRILYGLLLTYACYFGGHGLWNYLAVRSF